mmetsp:Transcript_18064/g.23776  ORF Transcript_18064/g.23776 Transcript_18064/m.23776 type:complete len:82 (+) Transcript_18064:137-382(+)
MFDKIKEYIFPNRNKPLSYRLASWGVAFAIAGAYYYYEQQKLTSYNKDFSAEELEKWNKKVKSSDSTTIKNINEKGKLESG